MGKINNDLTELTDVTDASEEDGAKKLLRGDKSCGREHCRGLHCSYIFLQAPTASQHQSPARAGSTPDKPAVATRHAEPGKHSRD